MPPSDCIEQRVGTKPHLIALAAANHNRLARAALKHKVADGERTAADVILNPPREAANMPIGELLCSQHRWGQDRCNRFLRTVEMMREAKTLGSMTDRQRRMLAVALTGTPDVAAAA